MTERRRADFWLVVIVGSTIAAVVAAMVASGSALTTVPLVWFLAVCPGMPYVRMVGASQGYDTTMRWITAIGLSLALDAIVAEALLFSDAYTGLRTVAVLGVLACAGAVIDWRRVRRSAPPADAPVGSVS